MAQYADAINQGLSLLTVLGGAAAVVLIAALLARKSGARISLFERALSLAAPYGLALAFVVAASGVVASLYYSEIAGYLPCTLCWWQRIFLYSGAVILGVAFILRDMAVRPYALALSHIGGVIAAYHTYLQFGGSPFVPCAAGGASCAQRYFLLYGYVTIPTMALTAFALIVALLLAQKTAESGE